MSGVLVGLVTSSGAIAGTLVGVPVTGWLAILVAQPAPWSVPLAFLTMVVVSRRGRPASWARTAMLRLHLNEEREQTPADRLRTLRERAQSAQTNRG
jgi:hypothetical protein